MNFPDIGDLQGTAFDLIPPKEELVEALRVGEKHREYNCHSCGWAEDDARLDICDCGRNLVCRECRNVLGLCLDCTEFDLPPGVKVVGNYDKCDVVVKVTTWTESLFCIASHYYVSWEVPSYSRYGRLQAIPENETWRPAFNLRTEKPQLIAPYIRRILKLLLKWNKSAISRRKDGKLFVRIEHKDTRMQLMKKYTSRPLDGD